MPAPTPNPRELLKKLALRTIAAPNGGAASGVHPDFVINMADWQWHQGVALFGLFRAAEALDDDGLRAYTAKWLDERLLTGPLDKRVNTVAPALTAACLYERKRDHAHAVLCHDYADWCMSAAPRLADGTVEHDPLYPGQVWADTLFMLALFLAKWGLVTGEARYVDEAIKQFKKHYHYLGDPRSGLAFHGYDAGLKKNIGTLWGRGNGWLSMALLELLAMLGPRHPARADVCDIMRRQFAGVLATQCDDGAWRTVMDVPETYEESTCTAAFACAFSNAAALGLGTPAMNASARRVTARALGWMNDKGEMEHASAGTPLQENALEYNKIPRAVTAFSQGIAMLFLSATIRPLAYSLP